MCDVCGGSRGSSTPEGLWESPSGVELASLPILHLHTQLSAHSIPHQLKPLSVGSLPSKNFPHVRVYHTSYIRDGRSKASDGTGIHVRSAPETMVHLPHPGHGVRPSPLFQKAALTACRKLQATLCRCTSAARDALWLRRRGRIAATLWASCVRIGFGQEGQICTLLIVPAMLRGWAREGCLTHRNRICSAARPLC